MTTEQKTADECRTAFTLAIHEIADTLRLQAYRLDACAQRAYPPMYLEGLELPGAFIIVNDVLGLLTEVDEAIYHVGLIDKAWNLHEALTREAVK